jgi:ABC-type glycerol-3-phosphate transport system substrate-binding protein
MADTGKKVKAIIAAIILLLMLQNTGCSTIAGNIGQNTQNSTAAPAAKSSQPITVWIHPFLGDEGEEEAMWNSFLKDFSAENPDIKVNLQSISWANRDQKMLSAFSAGKGPDVMYLISDHLVQFANMEVIEALDSYMDNALAGDYNEGALKSVTVNGHVYGLPMLQSVVTYLYNVDLLDKAGVDTKKLPETWEEFDRMCEKVKAIGKLGTNYSGGYNSYMTFYPLLWQAGGDVIDENGAVTVNSPEAVKALTRIVEMYKKGYIS